MSELVVLGPTGNVGSALLRLWQETGRTARTGNRQDFDYFRPETYLPLFRGATHLFLLTPVVENMVDLTRRLLGAAREAGIGKIVKISALGAAPGAMPRLLRWHGEAEELVRACGIPWVILRPNAFMQNFIQYYGPVVRRVQRLPVPGGQSRVSFIDADDVAKVACLAIESEAFSGHTLELTGPEALSFHQAAKILSLALQKEIHYVDVPEAEARRTMTAGNLPEWRIEALLELYASYRNGEASKVTGTVHEITGKAPRTLHSFLLSHLEELS